MSKRARQLAWASGRESAFEAALGRKSQPGWRPARAERDADEADDLPGGAWNMGLMNVKGSCEVKVCLHGSLHGRARSGSLRRSTRLASCGARSFRGVRPELGSGATPPMVAATPMASLMRTGRKPP